MQDLIEAYMSVYESFDDIEEATAMAKRGYDEAPIRQQIAKRTGGGKAADRATALENKPTYGDKNKQAQRSRYARAQRRDFRSTTSSSPGLHGYGYQSNDPKVKEKQAARGAQRGSAALTPKEKQQLNREQADFYDLVLSHLLDEGYCDSQESAVTMMAAMSQDWIDSILSEAPFQISGPHPTTVDGTKLDYTPSNVGKPYQNKKRAQTKADKLNQDHGASVYRVTKVD